MAVTKRIGSSEVRYASRRAVFLLTLCALTLAALLLREPPAADAHARLVASDPAAASALTTAPAAFRLVFSEPIEPSFSSADLRDTSGNVVATLRLQAAPDDSRVLMLHRDDSQALEPGTYLLVWRVLSSIDGHATTGSLAFSVGTGQAPVIAGTGDSISRPPWWRVAIHWFEVAALVVMAGGWTYGALILRPWRDAGETGQRLLALWQRQWAIAAGALIVGMALALVDQAVLVSGQASGSNGAPGLLWQILTASRYGATWLSRLGLLAALMIVAQTALRHQLGWLAGLALSVLALLTIPLSGHAAADQEPALAIISDWIHLAAASAWLGSLAYLALVLLTRDGRTSDAAPTVSTLISRFSRLSVALVLGLIVTGIVNAATNVAGQRSLITQDYGTALQIKIALVVAVLVPAGANLLINVPRLRSAADSTATTRVLTAVRRTALAELVIGATILLAAATLAEIPPADGPLPVDVAARIVNIDEQTEVGDLRIRLQAALAGTPDDRYTIAVATADGQTPENLQRVIVRSTLLGEDGNEIASDRFDADALPESPGTYTFPALRLATQGPWDLTITVRQAGVEDQQASVRIDTRGSGPLPPRTVADTWRWPRLTPVGWFSAVLGVVIAIGGIVGLRFLRGVEPLAGSLVLTMIALVSAGFIVSALRQSVPITPSTHLTNPIPADEGTLLRAETTYAQYCLVCHGDRGAGVETDNPLHAHGDAADLTDTTSRAQRDGDLYHAITYGVPGTAMPAYEEALDERERWELVRYLRSLQGVGS